MFLLSISLILSFGFIAGYLMEKIKIPKIIGMLIVGILLGPSVLDIIDKSVLNISAELRQVALVIILTRAGLSLDFKVLRKVGRPALMLSVIPATFEMIGVTIFAPLILNISFIEALLLASVLAAVSPAIIVPRAIKYQQEGFGKKKHIPSLILTGASVDDVFVIILFYSFLGLNNEGSLDSIMFLNIPVSIMTGIVMGVMVGFVVSKIFKYFNFETTVKVVILISLSFLLIYFEEFLKENKFHYSSLLSIMAIGITIKAMQNKQAKKIEKSYKKLWLVFEIFLFVLVGAEVNLNSVSSNGFKAVGLIAVGLAFRGLGVFACLIKTNLAFRERIFIAMAYIPKATVQASIGAIALHDGLPSGEIILTVAVLSILVTAPIGAILMDTLHKKFLEKETVVIAKNNSPAL